MDHRLKITAFNAVGFGCWHNQLYLGRPSQILYIGNTHLADLPCIFLWKIWYIWELWEAEQGTNNTHLTVP